MISLITQKYALTKFSFLSVINCGHAAPQIIHLRQSGGTVSGSCGDCGIMTKDFAAA
ncbi:hypothetical protein BFJ69_g4857 [Fusarium oxysporum]|jgi:hypothetical protein|uniref:Uncharacterized protein n=1 Tax=Fusarium oxysporum TaxID=5507 RepID=A0A420NGP7_FUSOX|nr:hypothetical protein BFJ69_g4857 [Fusarium oxysporum]